MQMFYSRRALRGDKGGCGGQDSEGEEAKPVCGLRSGLQQAPWRALEGKLCSVFSPGAKELGFLALFKSLKSLRAIG